jgi:hypothetical protein
MIGAEEEISLGASPAEVWSVLTDFAHHSSWHPFFRLKGEPQLGEIAYTYTSALAPERILRAPAIITRLEPDACFEWNAGVRRLFKMIETFTLEPVEGGTRMIHRIEYRGIQPWLFRRQLAAKAANMVVKTNQSLAAHIAKLRLRPVKSGPIKAVSKKPPHKPVPGKRRRR